MYGTIENDTADVLFLWLFLSEKHTHLENNQVMPASSLPIQYLEFNGIGPG